MYVHLVLKRPPAFNTSHNKSVKTQVVLGPCFYILFVIYGDLCAFSIQDIDLGVKNYRTGT